MAVTIYTKTEKNEQSGKLYINGWLWFETSINVTPSREIIRSASGQSKARSIAANDTNIYCHQNAATEPNTDGNIKTSIFDDAETIYSGNGYIKSFTSETGFFTSNQDFDEHENLWTMHYVNKYVNLTSGYTPYMKVEFYKRDSSNNDTLLFSKEVSVGSIYISNGNNVDFAPTGSVTTSDRLRIRVYGGERAPA
ncbi:MAG: hypothetical protein U9O94_04355 [Nanoarchaeota archaeon]|nr:hypothetical protein [Nanoarchaeota archaeon]